jgi:hypothetical protein
MLGNDIAGRLHGAASRMCQDYDERRAQHHSAIFDRAEGRGVDQVTGVSGNEQFANAMSTEYQFWGYAAVGAADDSRPRRLVRLDGATLLSLSPVTTSCALPRT